MEYNLEIEVWRGYVDNPQKCEEVYRQMATNIINQMDIEDLVQLFSIRIQEPQLRETIHFKNAPHLKALRGDNVVKFSAKIEVKRLSF